ncbi:MAG: protein kinase [Bacteroidetes bacterium]|nr:protein kinase [Bacteroidota bacterium]
MIGKTILHYEILEQIGEGGMGVVYKAEDTKLKREVAIKFLPRFISINKAERKRFEIEAQAAALLNHPNIATIYAIEETEDEMFIVMEFIDGKELKDKINSGPIPVDEAINIATQIAEGLEAAHKKGIIHRDIKSSNIMITKDGKVKIMDFGLAKIKGGTELTKIGTTLGTTAYMSPEQTKGEEVDSRTDIWALGVLMYQMLTNELPFKGEYDQAIIYSILNEEPQTIKNNDIQPSILKVVKKALEKKCEKRYGQITELIEELKSKDKSVNKTINKDIPKEIKKLAVLPFSNLVNDSQTNFLGFALADQIIGAMAYSKNVLVRPSSSIRKYQNELIDIQKAGSELNVNYVLAGNYLKESDTIRLNIELVELESEEMIWREPIQIKYNNVFELQDIVSQKVVNALKIQFSDEERERMKSDTPQNPVAYEFYLRAISFPFTIEGNKIALEMLNRSISLDPYYALAYLELGSRNNQLSQVGDSTSQAHKKAEDALLKALSLKNDLLPALANLALIYTDVGRHKEAHALLIRALKINPNDSWLHFSLSYHYRYTGFLEESEKEIETALSIDPNNHRFRSSIVTYMFLGKYDEILESFNLALESPFTLNYLGEVAFRKGDKKLAIEYFEKVLKIKNEISEFYFASSLIQFINGNIKNAADFNLKRELENPADSEILYEIARIYGLFEMSEDCCRALKKSIDMGYISYPSMQRDSFLDPVRNDKGIQDLLALAKMKHEELKKELLTTY